MTLFNRIANPGFIKSTNRFLQGNKWGKRALICILRGKLYSALDNPMSYKIRSAPYRGLAKFLLFTKNNVWFFFCSQNKTHEIWIQNINTRFQISNCFSYFHYKIKSSIWLLNHTTKLSLLSTIIKEKKIPDGTLKMLNKDLFVSISLSF